MSSKTIKYTTRIASRSSSGNYLTVLVFHKVLLEKKNFYADVPNTIEFAHILDWISEQFHIVKLSDAIRAIEMGTLPERAAAITFDDGNRDTLNCSAPILEKKQLPATFFINTAYIEGGEPFFERIYKALETTTLEQADLSSIGQGIVSLTSDKSRRTLADRLCETSKYLHRADAEVYSWRVVDALQAASNVEMATTDDIAGNRYKYIEYGGHSHNHTILTTLDNRSAEKEIYECREIITKLTGQINPIFAYPNGKPGRDFTKEHQKIVKQAGFSAAFSCEAGTLKQRKDFYNAPRFTAWDTKKIKFQTRMLLNIIQSRCS